MHCVCKIEHLRYLAWWRNEWKNTFLRKCTMKYFWAKTMLKKIKNKLKHFDLDFIHLSFLFALLSTLFLTFSFFLSSSMVLALSLMPVLFYDASLSFYYTDHIYGPSLRHRQRFSIKKLFTVFSMISVLFLHIMHSLNYLWTFCLPPTINILLATN